MRAESLSLSGIVNAIFVHDGSGRWTLVDTGLPLHFEAIRQAAARRFGADSRPRAILLTHGHPDHAGSARALAAYWDAPLYAHPRELPFVTGRADYPPLDTGTGDPTALGAQIATLIGRLGGPAPNAGRDLGDVRPLPDDLTPLLGAGWETVPLPGHTAGQVGFWHAQARLLIAGDALSSLPLDSWHRLLRRRQGPSLPPTAATTDWESVRRSLRTIAALAPTTVLCGHGPTLLGPDLPQRLQDFADYAVVPRQGRYASEPVRIDDDGRYTVPPIAPDPVATAFGLLRAAAVLGGAFWLVTRLKERR